MKNQQQKLMFFGLGAIFTFLVLLAMGRIRTERYETMGPTPMGPSTMGPSAMGPFATGPTPMGPSIMG